MHPNILYFDHLRPPKTMEAELHSTWPTLIINFLCNTVHLILVGNFEFKKLLNTQHIYQQMHILCKYFKKNQRFLINIQ